MAWPTNWFDGEDITDTRLTQWTEAQKTWPANVDANNNSLLNVSLLTASTKVVFKSVTLADGASVSLATLGSMVHGFLLIHDSAAAGPGLVYLNGGLDAVTELIDGKGAISITDTSGFICIFPSGGQVYTLKNRVPSTTLTFYLTFIGL